MRALFSAAGTGPLDGRAFDAVYRDCVADVHAYALALLRDRACAEDVTALAFERLYRSRARLDPARGTPRAWLFAIARNAALDELRRRRSRPQPLAEDDLEDTVSIGQPELLDRLARREIVREALTGLAAREREIVLLKFHGQLSNGELARVLGISESNAGTRLHRALERLRERCEVAGREEVA
ncbi:MAG: RNA polymerase sigma factor [Solirubrobacteraceae bacterium]